jgi:cytochrome c5
MGKFQNIFPLFKHVTMKKILTITGIFILAACSTAKLLTPAQADADRGAQKFTGYTLDELNQGKSIYTAHCNKCHRYKVPESRKEAKWDKVIPKMAKKAKLDSVQQSLVLKYVVTMSTATTK